MRQTETAAIKKSGATKSSVFTRELTEMYTKARVHTYVCVSRHRPLQSTMIGEDVEASDDVTAGSATGSHYLMCVVEHNADAQDAEHASTISLVAVNIATGQLSCAVPGA